MATLSSGQVSELHAEIMALWSQSGTQAPIAKAELETLIGQVDSAMEGYEASFVSGLDAGATKTWLEGAPWVVRCLFETVARKRKTSL